MNDAQMMKCKKCGHVGDAITIVEPFPCSSVRVDEEDPDYQEHLDGIDVDGDLRIGLEVCRNCYAIAGFWIEDAGDAEFRSDWGKERTALEAVQVEPAIKLNESGVPEWQPPLWGGKRTPGTLFYATPQEPAVNAEPGLDDKNIANRLDRWFVEGLHASSLTQCPYQEDTASQKWWMRGCNHSIMLAQKEAAVKAELLEAAKRLVEHADFKLGGALSADSKAKEIPSNAVSQVKARHLAALRAAIAKAEKS